MPNVKPIPDGYHTVTPHIVVKDIRRAVEFYKKAFGAEERFMMPGPDGKSLMHGEMKIGNSHVMLAAENPQWKSAGPLTLGGTPVSLSLYVTECDKSFKRAVDAGAKELRPVSNQFYGDRMGTLEDPFGHVWSIGTHVEDVPPEEMRRRSEEMMKQKA